MEILRAMVGGGMGEVRGETERGGWGSGGCGCGGGGESVPFWVEEGL